MKAISIKEPWASYIYNGKKSIETRTWKTNYRGKILLCASKKPTSKISGKAFAIANLVDIKPMTKEDVNYALCDVYPNAYSWFLDEIKTFDFPFKVKGSLGIFNVSDKIIGDCSRCGFIQCPEECFNSHEGSMIALRKLCNASGKKVHIIGEQQAGKNFIRSSLCQ